MSEENIQNNEISTKDQLINALNGEFASGANFVYITSLGKEIGFREISVKEQKSMTRTMAANENRKDIIYDAQCALIQNLCLDSSFDIYKVSEFDRLKLLLALYQSNMFANDIKAICDNCGSENTYKIDFEKTIAKLNSLSIDPIDFVYENKNFIYNVKLVYPVVKLVSNFHKSYMQRHAPKFKQQIQTDDTMSNIEYINLFIDTIKIQNKKTKSTKIIKMREFKVGDIEDILAAFPQDLLYAENGIIKKIINDFIKPFNEQFDKHTCYNCGNVLENGGINNSESFF